jgi:LysM repeat protein
MTSHRAAAKSVKGPVVAAVAIVAAVAAVTLGLVLVRSGHSSSGSPSPSQGATSPVTSGTNTPPVAPSAPATPAVAATVGASAITVSPVQPTAFAASKSKAPPAKTPTYVRYTVMPGDNLFVIAQWFHQQGYTPIYEWNQTVIGKDPELIRPGQTLIVAVKP